MLQIAFFYFYFSSIGKDGKKKLLSIISIYYRLLSIDPLFIDSDGDVNSFPHKEYWRTCSCTVLFEHGE